MREVIIGLQFTALIPIIVFLIYKPTLNNFFKLLLASVFLSLLFDIMGTICSFIFKNNISVLCTYFLLNTLLITFLWQKVPFYLAKTKTIVQNIGFAFLGIMILFVVYFKFTPEALYILSSLSVLLGLIFALQYYYQKILLATTSPPLLDPYFIVASGVMLFSLSTIIILAAQIHYEGQSFMPYTWALRQTFYTIYNMIIGYAFYVLYKTQAVTL